MTPTRIQRKRLKGWRMPQGAVYVGRPTKWGNPFVLSGGKLVGKGLFLGVNTPVEAVEKYRRWIEAHVKGGLADLSELRGKDLACFCSLTQPCHADVLLEIANAEPEAADGKRS